MKRNDSIYTCTSFATACKNSKVAMPDIYTHTVQNLWLQFLSIQARDIIWLYVLEIQVSKRQSIPGLHVVRRTRDEREEEGNLSPPLFPAAHLCLGVSLLGLQAFWTLLYLHCLGSGVAGKIWIAYKETHVDSAESHTPCSTSPAEGLVGRITAYLSITVTFRNKLQNRRGSVGKAQPHCLRQNSNPTMKTKAAFKSLSSAASCSVWNAKWYDVRKKAKRINGLEFSSRQKIGISNARLGWRGKCWELMQHSG